MRLKEGFRIRPLGREFIVTAEGLGQVNFNRMIALNSSAAFLWNQVGGKDFEAEDLANLLVEKYDVGYEKALADSKSIAEKWIEAGIAEK